MSNKHIHSTISYIVPTVFLYRNLFSACAGIDHDFLAHDPPFDEVLMIQSLLIYLSLCYSDHSFTSRYYYDI